MNGQHHSSVLPWEVLNCSRKMNNTLFFSTCSLLIYAFILFKIFFLCPNFALHHLVCYTFLLLRTRKERREGWGGQAEVCWLTNRLPFVQIDGHTHPQNTELNIDKKNSAWLGSSWFFESLLCLPLFSPLLLNWKQKSEMEDFFSFITQTCMSVCSHTHRHNSPTFSSSSLSQAAVG